MKRLILLAVFLLLAAVPTLALDNDRHDGKGQALVDEVIRMSQGGVGEDEILTFIKAESGNYSISADDVIELNDARVSKTLIKAVISEAGDRLSVRPERERRVRSRAPSYYVGRPYVGVGWYDPWYSPFWYDSWWYGPSYGFGPRYDYRGRWRRW